ncbi:hypothetical protein AYO47_02945 [Planctomyces sp. SCGC AG-212-M04]|nr:hypothetical protein AYO47_02945 [Planctomyces sp. SCGC AG-212-M04]
MNFQVVRARDGFHVLQKEHAKLGEMYVDATGFNETDWTDHSAVAAAMTADNKEYLMKERPTSTPQKKVDRFAGSSIPTTR